MASVDVVVTGWRRPGAFRAVLAAVQAQTVTPTSVHFFQNAFDDPPLEAAAGRQLAAAWEQALEGSGGYVHAKQPGNLGVWSRFLYAAELPSEFCLVVDDDAVAGPRWLENCLTTFATTPGVLGAVGVVYPPGKRRPYVRYGWVRPEDTLRQVDVAGHAWFFRREWLTAFRDELPRFGRHATCGEDYHLSYCVQRHYGLGTYCPPQPCRELAGSTQPRLGRDRYALWRTPGEERKKLQVHRDYLAAGWRTLRGA